MKYDMGVSTLIETTYILNKYIAHKDKVIVTLIQKPLSVSGAAAKRVKVQMQRHVFMCRSRFTYHILHK